MNILILINNAIKMAEFHSTIGHLFIKNNENVYYALTDRLMLYTENVDLGNPNNIFIFSDFFKKHYDEDIVLDSKYKLLNLNKWIYPEYDRNIKYFREKYNGDKYNDKLKNSLLLFFDEIINKYNIDICVYESISNSFAYAAYETIKASNGLYIGYSACRMPNRFGLYTEEFGEVYKFKEAFENVDLDDIQQDELEEIDSYLDTFKSQILNSYHPRNSALDWNYSFFKRYFNKEKLSLLSGAIKYLVNEKSLVFYTYQTGNPLIHQLRSFKLQVKKQFKIRTLRKYFDKPVFDEKYFLYPQHFKPEASTSVLSSKYCSDLTNIENIAFSLPEGYKLYVKEHFVNYGRMSSEYYKKLKQIPNVKLIGCEENTKELINNSQGIITLTSTVGFEALLMGKRVYVFGEVFYKAHPNCVCLSSFNNLYDVLINEKPLLSNRDVDRKFIKAYKNISYPGMISYNIGLSCQMTDVASNFVNAFYTYLKEINR